jgi:hypothetical protein
MIAAITDRKPLNDLTHINKLKAIFEVIGDASDIEQILALIMERSEPDPTARSED